MPKTNPSDGGRVVRITLDKPVKSAGGAKVVKAKAASGSDVGDDVKRRKSQWTSFLLDFLATERRFVSTSELIEAGQKNFRLAGKEKDTAKNTIQATLIRLGGEGQIQQRKKDSERVAYWAANGTNDEGFTKETPSPVAPNR